jgi:D-alanyl-D-alanine carboxypeptidase/D-alanyl-D-alanine-endopeptidase (penicillin-binding protein 4)
MKNVKSFAGYVYTKSRKKLAFTIIVNDFNCSSSQLVKKIEPIMNALYLY